MPDTAMNPDPDAVLMLRLKNGEDSPLNTLMTRWQQPLVIFIYRYIGHETDALDLALETFVRVYQTRQRYTAQAKFSTWLFATAIPRERRFTGPSVDRLLVNDFSAKWSRKVLRSTTYLQPTKGTPYHVVVFSKRMRIRE
jgi:hypothetical protein